MPKEHVIIFALLCIIAFGLGYWHSTSKMDSGERVEVVAPPAPTVVTNVVTNTLKEVVTNIVAAIPQPTPVPTPPTVKPTPAPVKPQPQPTPTNIIPASSQSAIVEKAIREVLVKPTSELTKADLRKVTVLYLGGNQLTEVPKGLEKLTQLRRLNLIGNQLTNVKGLEKLDQLERLYLDYNKLTSVKGLEKLTQLTRLTLNNNPDLTKAQIDELKKALPECLIYSNPAN